MPGREVQDIDKILSLGSTAGVFSYPSPLFGANVWTRCYLLGSQMGENDGVESAALIYTCTPAQAQPQLLLADRFERKKPYINLPLSHKYISALGDHEAAHYTTS